MKLIWTRQGLGFVLAKPGFVGTALLRSAVDGKPVIAYYRDRGVSRVIRPLGGKK